ncbi:MAG: hypothetical protein ABFC18_03275 [Rikenellaceae bacterium]
MKKIIEILNSYRIWFGDSMAIHEDAFVNLTDDIESLYQPQIDKLKQIIELQGNIIANIVIKVSDEGMNLIKVKNLKKEAGL